MLVDGELVQIGNHVIAVPDPNGEVPNLFFLPVHGDEEPDDIWYRRRG